MFLVEGSKVRERKCKEHKFWICLLRKKAKKEKREIPFYILMHKNKSMFLIGMIWAKKMRRTHIDSKLYILQKFHFLFSHFRLYHVMQKIKYILLFSCRLIGLWRYFLIVLMDGRSDTILIMQLLWNVLTKHIKICWSGFWSMSSKSLMLWWWII